MLMRILLTKIDFNVNFNKIYVLLKRFNKLSRLDNVHISMCSVILVYFVNV